MNQSDKRIPWVDDAGVVGGYFLDGLAQDMFVVESLFGDNA